MLACAARGCQAGPMKRALVGLDGSPSQARVLEEAAELASRLGAQLVLFRSVAIPVELPVSAFSSSPDGLVEILVAGAREQLGAVGRGLGSGILGGIRVELGVPWRAILDAAKAESCDLVIIGSHGYGGLDRLLGTTAAKVVNHAHCSVLVVRI